MIGDVMVHHLESFNLIRNLQHGFSGGRSYLTNLLLFLDTVSWGMDEGWRLEHGCNILRLYKSLW